MGYNILIQLQIQENRRKFEDKPIYGKVLLSDNSFRIVNNVKTGTKDAREQRRGVECKGESSKIIELMKLIPLYPPEDVSKELLTERLSVEEMKQELGELAGSKNLNIDAMTDSEVQFYWLWYKSGWSTSDMCGYMREEMDKRGLILYQ